MQAAFRDLQGAPLLDRGRVFGKREDDDQAAGAHQPVLDEEVPLAGATEVSIAILSVQSQLAT